MTDAAAIVFSRTNRIQALLDVEVALADALAAAEVIPGSSASAIRAAASVEQFDLDTLDEEARTAGNILIPLVRHLTQHVATRDANAAGHVHLGVTSQDVMDTALVLQLRTSVRNVLALLDVAAGGAAGLARRHVGTPIAGRTWLQQATPTTFGAKAAVWLDGLASARRGLALALDDALVLQFGGATGTLSSLASDAGTVERMLADRLELRVADIPWHTNRHRIAGVACALGMACGTLGKIGRDISLLAQTEVGEVSEPHTDGRGTSSSMPHKRNPVASAVAIAASIQAPGMVSTILAAMSQEHERALGGWQAEWDTLPALVVLTARAAGAMAETLPGLIVDTGRMRANLDAGGGVARAEGLLAALAPRVGRSEARTIVERVSAQAIATGRRLEDVAGDELDVRRHMSADELNRALDPAHLAGSASLFVERVLDRWQRDRTQG